MTRAVGIDLGTTNSALAYVNSDGRAETVRNRAGDLVTPSALFFASRLMVGRDAIRESVRQPAAYVDSFKLDMGRPYFRQKVCGVDVPPEVLSGILLQHMVEDAQTQIGTIARAVITVPAYFDETRRRATQRAGQMAGLEVLDIINEPTAAALAYSRRDALLPVDRDRQKPRCMLVYDLGGGTFDVTILEMAGNEVRALATDGDVRLGGRDFDERLLNHLAEQFLDVHDVDLRANPEPCANLWLAAQNAKHALSSRASVQVTLVHDGDHLVIDLTRGDFDQLTQDLLGRTELTTELVLKDAGLTPGNIDRVLLVGGSTRMPGVEQMLLRHFPGKLDRSLSPDEAVAQGAAMYALMLVHSPEIRPAGTAGGHDTTLININSHSLGVVGLDTATRRRVVSVVIPKNSPLPCTARRRFQTAKDKQKSVAVKVVEGESRQPEHCMLLGECVVHDLGDDLPAGTAVIVEFHYASNGLISVSAKVPDARRMAQATIVPELQADLEPLDVWKTRLLAASGGKDEPDAVVIGQRPPSAEGAAQELSQLYRSIGEGVLNVELPWLQARLRKKALDSHAQTTMLKTRLRQVEALYKAAITQADKIQTMAQLASLKSELAEVSRELEDLLRKLGSRCVDRGYMAAGVEAKVKRARRLREILSQHPPDSRV